METCRMLGEGKSLPLLRLPTQAIFVQTGSPEPERSFQLKTISNSAQKQSKTCAEAVVAVVGPRLAGLTRCIWRLNSSFTSRTSSPCAKPTDAVLCATTSIAILQNFKCASVWLVSALRYLHFDVVWTANLIARFMLLNFVRCRTKHLSARSSLAIIATNARVAVIFKSFACLTAQLHSVSQALKAWKSVFFFFEWKTTTKTSFLSTKPTQIWAIKEGGEGKRLTPLALTLSTSHKS